MIAASLDIAPSSISELTSDPTLAGLLDSLTLDQPVHTQRQLRQHLVGTAAVLVDWTRPRYLCYAGLFHSVYGTASYVHACANLDARESIQAIIGFEAELLVYLYCTCDRAALFEQVPAAGPRVLTNLRSKNHFIIREQTFSDLLELLAADMIEQAPFRSQPVPDDDRQRIHLTAAGGSIWLRAERYLSEPAFARMLELFRRSDSPTRSTR